MLLATVLTTTPATAATSNPASGPTSAATAGVPKVQVHIEVQDEAIKTTMWTTQDGCLYFSMDIVRSEPGGRLTDVASKNAKHCYRSVTWTTRAKESTEHLVQVSARQDKKRRPQLVSSAWVMPGVGIAPRVKPPDSEQLRIIGKITINDAAKGLDRRGGLETFPVDRTYTVGPGVSVRTDIKGCVGRDTGARTRLNIVKNGETIDVDGIWLFSETNSPRRRSCYGNVAKRVPISERIESRGSADFNEFHKKGGNWAKTKLTMTNDEEQVVWIDA